MLVFGGRIWEYDGKESVRRMNYIELLKYPRISKDKKQKTTMFLQVNNPNPTYLELNNQFLMDGNGDFQPFFM